MEKSYIQDLLNRLDSKEELPQSGPLRSSKDTVSWVACREAECLDDSGLIPELRLIVQRAKKVRDFQKLAIVTGHLIRNTGSSDALAVYDALMERSPQSDDAWFYILEHARKARVPSARAYAIRLIQSPLKRGLSYAAAIEYLGTMGRRDDVQLLGEQLEADCFGKCDPMYCICAISELEYVEGIPFLERAIERHRKSRKRQDIGVVHYAIDAIERITSMPPAKLANAEVIVWAIGSGMDARLAIVEFQGVFALLTCNSAWSPQESEIVTDRKAGGALAGKKSANASLRWHTGPKKHPNQM